MRRGGLRPALYAYGRAHKARDPCARRPSPSPAHKGRGHPAARPPHVGARSAGRAHSARILPPPMRLWVRCVSRFSPSSPPPLARWAEGSARSRPPAGGDGGRSHPPASFFWVAPTPSQSDALGIQGEAGFCASVHFPLDKLPRYLVRYSCEVTPAAFAALPSTSMVRQSPPSKTGGFCYIWNPENATVAAFNAPNATKPRYFVALDRPKQHLILFCRVLGLPAFFLSGGAIMFLHRILSNA